MGGGAHPPLPRQSPSIKHRTTELKQLILAKAIYYDRKRVINIDTRSDTIAIAAGIRKVIAHKVAAVKKKGQRWRSR